MCFLLPSVRKQTNYFSIMTEKSQSLQRGNQETDITCLYVKNKNLCASRYFSVGFWTGVLERATYYQHAKEKLVMGTGHTTVGNVRRCLQNSMAGCRTLPALLVDKKSRAKWVN